MTDFVDPLEEPFARDRQARTPLDPDVQEALDERIEAEHREAEDAEAGEADAVDGSVVTSASEGDPLDPTTPVDNLE